MLGASTAGDRGGIAAFGVGGTVGAGALVTVPALLAAAELVLCARSGSTKPRYGVLGLDAMIPGIGGSRLVNAAAGNEGEPVAPPMLGLKSVLAGLYE